MRGRELVAGLRDCAAAKILCRHKGASKSKKDDPLAELRSEFDKATQRNGAAHA